jgi:hydroxymethylpyrimidine pyrophosphatase-like HAD family hydrolase
MSMRLAALATDYDGTLADEGIVRPETIEALRRFRHSGRRVILVTGRTLSGLLQAFPDLTEFDRVVAENGATLYDPISCSEEILAEPPPPAFLERLEELRTLPLEAGRVIVATVESQREKVLDAIQSLGLELQIVFNKGSVMILPSGANKATGLEAALQALGLSTHSVAGIGDAENDHALLAACEFSAAVANALPALKDRVHLVTRQRSGGGVVELIEEILKNDLSSHSAWFGQPINVGQDGRAQDVSLRAAGVNLIAGTSGGGKSTVTRAFLEGLSSANYQFCVLDAAGDYETLEHTLVLGDMQHAPEPSDIVKALDKPSRSVVANLVALELDQKPSYFRKLFLRLHELRGQVGRPHCIAVDEAHHFLLEDGPPEAETRFEDKLAGTTLISVNPERLPTKLLTRVQTLIAAGEHPFKTIEAFASAIHIPPPKMDSVSLDRGQMLAWQIGNLTPIAFSLSSPATAQIRHRRRYPEGDLGPDRSFYFRGPESKLKLRAHNLITFLHLMEGVDDETWRFHLKRGDYSDWFRQQIKDDGLADEARAIEAGELPARETREQMHQLITRRYTLPA